MQHPNHIVATEIPKSHQAKLGTNVQHRRLVKKVVWGEDALARARDLTLPYHDELGRAFCLVVGLVACALEANHVPTDPTRNNNYHVAVTFDTLGWMAARAAGRTRPYCAKTIQRWLSPSAKHSSALRKWIAWRPWMTDTMKNYNTGNSCGAVIGCHVVRVYLSPLEQGKVQVKGTQMRRPWRNLETDIKAGKTARARKSSHVHIDKTTKDDARRAKYFMHDFSNTPQDKNLLQEYYLYPDISTVTGAAQLRKDVQQAARWLCLKLEDAGHAAWSLNHRRYLQAIWTVVKHEVVRGDSTGRELLRLAVKMAAEIDQDDKSTLEP